jgi:GMP synthase-like glutamine amidotransferase
LKLIILSGSGQSAYDTSVSWIPGLKDFIRHVYKNYPHVKIIGGCFGEQITAYSLGGMVEKMPYNAKVEKCLGREWIKPTDEFFE